MKKHPTPAITLIRHAQPGCPYRHASTIVKCYRQGLSLHEVLELVEDWLRGQGYSFDGHIVIEEETSEAS